MRTCVLDSDKTCTECNQCNICDLDAGKLCDNCCRCIEADAEYAGVLIDEIYDENDAEDDD